jgi:hypothetical protein
MSNRGTGILGTVQVVLIIAKFIDAPWNTAYHIPWVWVFTPVYITIAIVVLAMVVAVLAAISSEGK